MTSATSFHMTAGKLRMRLEYIPCGELKLFETKYFFSSLLAHPLDLV